MALIEAASMATLSSLSSTVNSPASSSHTSPIPLYPYSVTTPTQFQEKVRSESISVHSERRLPSYLETHEVIDIEDSGDLERTQKKIKVPNSLFNRYRRKNGLFVTDITGSEWCEKQMEFILIRGKPEKTEAMKAGIARHAELEEEEWCEKQMEFVLIRGRPKRSKAMQAGSARHTKLEEEVVTKIKVTVESIEDVWAVKFLNFIVGANQLLFDRLTRELPLLGLVEGVWMVGVIDEIRMTPTENPSLVETKTRSNNTLPAEPQKRNGRLQLMCYKYLWDNAVTNNFPTNDFFHFFGLNPHSILSKEINKRASSSGLLVETLEDMVTYFRNTCCLLPPAHDQLLLRDC